MSLESVCYSNKDHDDAPVCRVGIPNTLLHNWHTFRHASLTRKTYIEELNTALETVLSGAFKIKNDALRLDMNIGRRAGELSSKLRNCSKREKNKLLSRTTNIYILSNELLLSSPAEVHIALEGIGPTSGPTDQIETRYE